MSVISDGECPAALGAGKASSNLRGLTLDRRAVLTAMAVGVGALFAGCGLGGSPSWTSHPALSVPEAYGQVALLRARSSGRDLRAVVRGLAQGVRHGGKGLLGLGHGAFDKLGLPVRRPAGLVPMESFPGDVLEPARVGADLVLQLGGSSADEAGRLMDSLLSGIGGDALEVTWRSALQRDENNVEHGRALNRNGFGFVEGLANPPVDDRKAADAIALIAPGAGEQAWMNGGTYLAMRVLSASHDLWDAESVELQERIVGRRRDGTWLDGTSAWDEPNFAADPEGAVTPLDSHVRLVNPRDGSAEPRLLRRSWTWSTDGAREDGLLFMAFQSDLDAGFRRAQQRLSGDPLSRYVLATGGGYFAVPPDLVAGEAWEDVVLA